MVHAESNDIERDGEPPTVPAQRSPTPWIWGFASLLVLVGIWSYWPILQRLVGIWSSEPDYSHGFMVFPVACGLLWARRDTLPSPHWTTGSLLVGLLLIGLSQAFRFVGHLWYFKTLEEWSLLGWGIGAVLLLGGWKLLFWGIPALLFLVFMIPLPWRLESALSFPLQSVATSTSVWLLQFLGQPAIADGHVIRMGELRLEVAQACNGLRMFMSITAIGAAFVILFQRSLGHRLLLFMALAPIAIVANTFRIVMTALLYRWVSSDVGQAFSHDFAGWVMIPVAASMFLGWNWYLDHLFLEATEVKPQLPRDAQSRMETPGYESVSRA